MGIISHEAPRLTRTGPVPYPDYDAERPLEQGMVVSIETTMHHPKRGFIKLEDTIAVTVAGYEAFGDRRPRLELLLAAKPGIATRLVLSGRRVARPTGPDAVRGGRCDPERGRLGGRYC